mmetsp:Transcript_72518/g.172914  ORF Transcript_72518/g.172914 Transcript_72518/m.172914 type:complete len:211 (+) Transcript_72518:73-705(+)
MEVTLTSTEVAQARKAFDIYDHHRSGVISADDVPKLLLELKWSVTKCDSIVKEFFPTSTAAQPAKVDFEGFLSILRAVLADKPAAMRKHVARSADPSGGISGRDLREVQSRLRRCFQKADEQDRGWVTVPQFRQLLKDAGMPDRDGDDFVTAVAEQPLLAGDVTGTTRIGFEDIVRLHNAILEYEYQQDVKYLPARNVARPFHEVVIAVD